MLAEAGGFTNNNAPILDTYKDVFENEFLVQSQRFYSQVGRVFRHVRHVVMIYSKDSSRGRCVGANSDLCGVRFSFISMLFLLSFSAPLPFFKLMSTDWLTRPFFPRSQEASDFFAMNSIPDYLKKVCPIPCSAMCFQDVHVLCLV